MYICHSPSNKATKKATKAIQKCASTRRRVSLSNTAQPPSARGLAHEFGLLDDPHLRPHGRMPDPAVLVAGHDVFAGLLELRAEIRDVAGQEHQVDVALGDR